MTWFERLVGFPELNADFVREKIEIDGPLLISAANGRRLRFGTLTIPMLADLQAQIATEHPNQERLKLSEIIDDAWRLHRNPKYAGAMFQAASQFNLLEMASPYLTPEDGVSIYEEDGTQGPACAISCGAGTIYRNYFVPLDGCRGQTAARQINCLVEIDALLRPALGNVWSMENGYAFASEAVLLKLAEYLSSLDQNGRADIRSLLRIGVQSDTEVTTAPEGHLVSQAYCSAMPIGYSGIPASIWEPIARLVLEGAYEATLAAATKNARRTGNNVVFLTYVGGGVFRNPIEWITDAILHAARKFREFDLDCRIVSYGESNPATVRIIERFHAEE